MRVSRAEVEKHRAAIVAAAGRLFKERGFDGIAVTQLMADAGFTHGGFYNHFASKSDLAAAVTADLLEGAAVKLAGRADAEADRPDAFARYLEHYLSPAARDDRRASCAIAALGADVVRQDVSVQSAFAGGLDAYMASFARLLPDETALAPITALAAMVGALLLARAVAGADANASDEILENVRRNLGELGRARP